VREVRPGVGCEAWNIDYSERLHDSSGGFPMTYLAIANWQSKIIALIFLRLC
jgi:hypothetical protein